MSPSNVTYTPDANAPATRKPRGRETTNAAHPTAVGTTTTGRTFNTAARDTGTPRPGPARSALPLVNASRQKLSPAPVTKSQTSSKSEAPR